MYIFGDRTQLILNKLSHPEKLFNRKISSLKKIYQIVSTSFSMWKISSLQPLMSENKEEKNPQNFFFLFLELTEKIITIH